MDWKILPYSLSVSRAVALAVEEHRDQKYGGQPYLVHLMEVDGILCQYGHSDDLHRKGAYLHDLLEDTEASDALIAGVVGVDVLRIVRFCTDEKGVNRKERKAKTYVRMRREIAESPPQEIVPCVRVKLADRLANMRASKRDSPDKLRMYVKEAQGFKNVLYHPGMCDEMWAEFDALVGEG